MDTSVSVVGGGLAGSEAAWQLAHREIHVKLFEMRPSLMTGAHQTDLLGELVCSNSLGSRLPDRASGVLLSELKVLGSMLVECAELTSVPAGGALAVDRNHFAQMITERVTQHPNIELIREEVTEIPDGGVVIASGPLTSSALSKTLSRLTGEQHLYFFDAISPIVEADSVDMSIAFRGSRYQRGVNEAGDYINCPLDQDQYYAFVDALIEAERIELRAFEEAIASGVRAGMSRFFEGCLPIEIIAERGREALAFGPMRPVGLQDPRTGERPFAVLQLRQDDMYGSLYNLVGFQTNLRYQEQRDVFRMIPGLQDAVFARYGQMHRNTFIASPKLLKPTLQYRDRQDLFFAGQITGVEGYLGNVATGLLVGINLARSVLGNTPIVLPQTTMLGALCHYISHTDPAQFQPMKANFGIFPPLEDGVRRNRRERARAYAARSASTLSDFVCSHTNNAHSHI